MTIEFRHPAERVSGRALTMTSTIARGRRAGGARRFAGWLWIVLLLAILTFLVVYPVLMLLLGALTDTNPVIDGFGNFRL